MSRADNPAKPFKTDDLTEAGFLWCQGYEPTHTERTGPFVIFHFDNLDATTAAAMLGSPEHALCRRYSHAWRALRRMADEAQRNGGRR